MTVEEENVEELLNEIDLEFEANFDCNLQILGQRKESSSNNCNPIPKIHKVSSEESMGGA